MTSDRKSWDADSGRDATGRKWTTPPKVTTTTAPGAKNPPPEPKDGGK